MSGRSRAAGMPAVSRCRAVCVCARSPAPAGRAPQPERRPPSPLPTFAAVLRRASSVSYRLRPPGTAVAPILAPLSFRGHSLPSAGRAHRGSALLALLHYDAEVPCAATGRGRRVLRAQARPAASVSASAGSAPVRGGPRPRVRCMPHPQPELSPPPLQCRAAPPVVLSFNSQSVFARARGCGCCCAWSVCVSIRIHGG